MKKMFGLFALLAAMAMFASPASAGVSISLSTTGFGSVTQVAHSGGDTTMYTGTFGGFSVVSQTVTKNGSGGVVALVNTNNTTITNTSGSTETLYIIMGGNGFLSPIAPPAATLTSGITGNYFKSGASSGAADKITFQSYANGSDTITNSGISTAAQTATYAPTFGSTASITVNSLSAPYALVEAVQITLNKGGQIHFIGTTTLSGGLVTTPEPATMTLWGIGLAACGFAARRRRNAKVA